MATRKLDAPSPTWWADETERLIRSVGSLEARRFVEESMCRLWENAENDRRAQLFNRAVPNVLAERLGGGFTSESLTVGWFRDLFGLLSAEGERMSVGGGKLKSKAAMVVRDIMLVASQSGFHPKSPLFEWLERNGSVLATISIRRIDSIISSALATDSVPEFELFHKTIVRGGEPVPNISAVTFDTDAWFVRRLVLDALRESAFYKAPFSGMPCTEATFEFTKSLGFVPASLADFTVGTFSRQFQYFDSIKNKYTRGIALRALVHIYAHVVRCLPETQNQFSVQTGLPLEMLTRADFTKWWRQGYRAYVHNCLDPVPANPYWLLYPDEDELEYTCAAPASMKVDASYKDSRLQEMFASWLWREVPRSEEMRSIHQRMKRLLDTFVVSEEAPKPRATTEGVAKWMGEVKSSLNERSCRRYRQSAVGLLEYGLQGRWIDVDQAAFVFLSSKMQGTDANTESPSADPEDLRLLVGELEDRASGSAVDKLASYALATVVLTKLRIGSVLSLRIGDIIEDEPKHLHAVRVSTKSDGHGYQEVQIVPKVYRMLRCLIEETDDLRRRTAGGLGEYLFIYEAKAFGSVKRMSSLVFRNRLAEACDALGIERIRPSDIRRRYQTEVVLRGIEQNYSRLALGSLTGHTSLATTERYYVRGDIRQYLEATHGIEIGRPPIKGEIVPDDELLEIDGLSPSEDSVEMGAGYCRNPECGIQGTVSCLMCKGFITTPRCIPEMEEAVAAITRKIQECSNVPHDREHLIAVKRVYLKYLAVMYSMKEARR